MTQMWEVLQRISLLDGIAPGATEYSSEAHLGQMIGLLGPPPQKLLDKADPQAYSRYFNKTGELGFFRRKKKISKFQPSAPPPPSPSPGKGW